jgi:osmotically-inducible protein OsmY
MKFDAQFPATLKSIRRPMLVLIGSAAMAATLQGCLPVMVGGTVMGAMTVTDRRSLGSQADDTAIVLKAEGRAMKITGDQGRVTVNSFNRHVLITGEVKDEKMKADVEQQIKTIDGVKQIENDLEIAPVSSLSLRSNDLVISSKVKAAIVDTKDLYLSAFKVHTDRGVVYLMGRVTQREGKLAAEVARNAASKIKKVVKLFEYITEDDLKELAPRPPAEQPKDAPNKDTAK